MFPTRLASLRSPVPPRMLVAVVAAALLTCAGCVSGPTVIPPEKRTTIDRKLVEYPAGMDLQEIARDLTGPVDCEVDRDGNLIVAESGRGKWSPRVYGIRADGSQFSIYPISRRLPFPLTALNPGFRIYGPVGGIAVEAGKIYVSHRDKDGFGTITAFTYDGKPTTIVGGIPAQGDYGMSDIAVEPISGRLWFGVGSATNSGVVGLDNWASGWVKRYPKFSDKPFTELRLLGYRFDTPNPLAGLFGGADVAGTAPFQPFNSRYTSRIPAAENGRPTSAVFSCNPAGGGLRVEAHGIRYPRGIAFNEFGTPFVTNNGMELRGTRPVKDDPDALLRVVSATWYGFPDYSAELRRISEAKYQPAQQFLTTYEEVNPVVDHDASGRNGLPAPSRNLLHAVFPPLAGAAGLAFIPPVGPLAGYSGHAIVALSGDRAPFATSGQKLKGPTGYSIARVDTTTRTNPSSHEGEVIDFVRNTRGQPRSRLKLKYDQICLERPTAVKFDPSDGSVYIIDFGELELRRGREYVKPRTGRIFKLVPQPPPTTQPGTTQVTTTADADLNAE